MQGVESIHLWKVPLDSFSTPRYQPLAQRRLGEKRRVVARRPPPASHIRAPGKPCRGTPFRILDATVIPDLDDRRGRGKKPTTMHPEMNRTEAGATDD